jgi:DHA1 family inner membrane transport protein
VFTRAQVWWALLIGAIGFGGLFAVYTFVSPIVTEVTGVGLELVPITLVVCGLGMTVGNFVGGWYADRGTRRAIFVFFGAMIASLVGLGLTASTLPGLLVFVFLVGASASALSPSIQVRLMDVARDSQSIAAALNHSSLNIGNASGAFFGGVGVAAGFGYLAPVWIGLAMSVLGVGLAAISFALDRPTAGRERFVDGPRPRTQPIAIGG